MKFLDHLDLTGTALKNVRIDPVGADPTGLGAADEGRLVYNTVDDKVKVWDGTTWATVGGGTSGTDTFVGAKVYRTAAGSYNGGGGWDYVTFDTEAWDSGGLWNAANPKRLTAPVSGEYLISGYVHWLANGSDNHRRDINFQKNGTTGIGGVKAYQHGTEDTVTSGSIIVYLNAGDYVEMGLYSPTAGHGFYGGEALNNFSMTLLRRNVAGTVQSGQSWQAATLTNSWSNYPGYNTAGYWKDPLGWVHLKGLIRNGAVGQQAFTLPVGYRPAETFLHAVMSNSALGRVDVLSNGNVVPQGPSANPWVSLEGISFPTQDAPALTAPTLQNSWVHYGAPYATPGYYVDEEGICWLKGMLKNGTVAAAMFTLPESARPAANLIFAGIGNGAVVRIEVLVNGQVYVAAGASNAWVSLDGIAFPTRAATRQWNHPIPFMANGWTRYTGGGYYSQAGYFVNRFGIVFVTGMVQGGAAVTDVGYLPPGAMPTNLAWVQGIFLCLANNAAARVDIKDNGAVHAESPMSSAWLSLDNIRFRGLATPLS